MAYSIVPGFFVQNTGSGQQNALESRFGLLDDSADRWGKLLSKLKELNEANQDQYKLIIAGRHGQGFHNLAEAKYGTEIWEKKWAKLDGDDEITWGPDPLLTKEGEKQAKDAKSLWIEELSANMLIPSTFYASPLTRALQTCRLTFEGFTELSQKNSVILEGCRERYGVHSCDKRRERSAIQQDFQEFRFEDDFPEEDILFSFDTRETEEHVASRAKHVLDNIFNNDAELVISITAHSGFINGLISVTGHPPFQLGTGGILPMIVKRAPVSQGKPETST